jgi:hypothetical protein
MLFQDGSVNEYSKIRYAKDENIIASIAVFKSHFPHGEVFPSPANIGVAENFDRAERYVFETHPYDCAYFFEDDMVLSENYIETMDVIWDAVRNLDHIAYFAAYGDHLHGGNEVGLDSAAVTTLQHHWAFGLKRAHWVEMRRLIQPYFDIVSGRDYRHRDWFSIASWYNSLGFATRASSQDSVKALATNLLNRWRVNTVACLGRYIGEEGLNFTPAHYRSMGFGEIQLFPSALKDIKLPPAADISRIIDSERVVYRDINAKNASFLSFMNKAADEDDIRNAYLYIFGREPDSEMAVKSRMGMPLHKLRSMFFDSREFKINWLARHGRSI